LAEIPTAVFCYNDMSALGAMRSIRERGLEIPRDISLVGFDDLFLAEFSAPPLTTVRQPRREMGRLATELLLRVVAGHGERGDIRVPGELIVRASTAPPPALPPIPSLPGRDRKGAVPA